MIYKGDENMTAQQTPTKARGKPRTAKEVIDELLKENHRWERIFNIVICAFLGVFAGVVVAALMNCRGDVLSIACGAANFIILSSLAYVWRIRRENMATRLLEIPLSKAETSEKAAEMIQEMYIQVFVHRKG